MSLKNFTSSLLALALKVGERVQFHGLDAFEEGEQRLANQAHSGWNGPEPQGGIARRAWAHYGQMAKPTTGRVGLIELVFKTSYESVHIGVATIRWQQVWEAVGGGQRVGAGYVPYVRYVTSGGDATLYSSLEELEGSGLPHFTPEEGVEDVGLQRYLCRLCGKGSGERAAIEAVIAAHREVWPSLRGWIEKSNPEEPADGHRYVWSDGDVADQTVMAALADLRALDLLGNGFRVQRVEVGVNLNRDPDPPVS